MQLAPILFIAMEFAPVNTTGNFRSLKFVKYLREYGIDPIIVTFKEDEGAKYFKAKVDTSLLKEIPSETKIYRIHCSDGAKYYRSKFRAFINIFFSVKDSFAKRWEKHLMPSLDEIIRDHRPKLIYTSLPPFSSGMLAAKIARKYRLPLIVDMRDLYAMWCNTPYGSIAHFWLTLAEERRIFRSATKVIGVTPQLIAIFRKSHPNIDSSKFDLITNGYDGNGDIPVGFTFPVGMKRIVIGYVGSFYYIPEARKEIFEPWWKKKGHKMLRYTPIKEDWLYRSPYFFFKTIQRIFQLQPDLRDVITIEFIGQEPSWLSGMISECELADVVKIHGVVSHDESLALQKNFDLLLATSEKVLNDEHYSLPSKVFDYVRLGKPILGFVTPGVQREFIVRSGLGIICDPDNIAEAGRTLRQLLNEGATFKPVREFLESFHRRVLAGKLSSLMKSTISDKVG